MWKESHLRLVDNMVIKSTDTDELDIILSHQTFESFEYNGESVRRIDCVKINRWYKWKRKLSREHQYGFFVSEIFKMRRIKKKIINL